MGRSEPDYVPQEIRIRASKFGGVNSYSESVGLSPTRLYSFFGANNTRIRAYYLLANYCGISVDALIDIIKEDKIVEYIDSVKLGHANDGIKSIAGLEKAAGVGDGFITNLRAKRYAIHTFTEWQDLAGKLGWSVHKLAENTLKQ